MLFPLRFEKPCPVFFFLVSPFLKGAVGQRLRRIPLGFSAAFSLSLGKCHSESLVKQEVAPGVLLLLLTVEGRAPAPLDEPEFLLLQGCVVWLQ